MKVAELEEAFKNQGLDIRQICEDNFQDLAKESNKINNRSIGRFLIKEGTLFFEIIVFQQKDNKKTKPKTILQSLYYSECRECWYKDSKEDALLKDSEILDCFLKVEAGKFIVGYLTPFSHDLNYFDSLEEGLTYLKDKYAF